jgi:hypothetical protein
MPLVTIKVFKDELSDSQAKELIHKITETVIPFVGRSYVITPGSSLRKLLANPELVGRRLVLKMFAQFRLGSERPATPS